MVNEISGPHGIFTLITRLPILWIWNIKYLRSFQILEQVGMAISELLDTLQPDSKFTLAQRSHSISLPLPTNA